MANKELSIVSDAANILKEFGGASLVYATAELSPFSNQQKPDLVIHPANDKNIALFVEYKIAPENGFRESFWNAFDEKKTFVKESSEVSIDYIFATNIKIQEKIKSELESHDIVVFDEVCDAEKLSSKIKTWYSNANK